MNSGRATGPWSPGAAAPEPAPAPPGREEVELYTRTFLTVLRSSGEVRLRVLERVHLGMHSALHPLGAESRLDSGALLYSLHRLPPVTLEMEHVLMGQSPDQLLRTGMDGAAWEPVAAPGRRRRWWWDPGSKTLAVALASSSDLDDLVPTLVALQIEWNKAHRLLRSDDSTTAPVGLKDARQRLGIGPDDWQRLKALFGPRMAEFLATVGRRPLDLRLRLVGGSQVAYARATREWWGPIGEVLSQEGLRDRPIYFVSSNAHCLVNLLSGVARERSEHVLLWAEGSSDPELRELVRLQRRPDSRISPENFLYYAARLWFDAHPRARQGRTQ
ncbi:MAG: DUF6909 family protein, partial [Candidatus Dormibacteria bacterium]